MIVVRDVFHLKFGKAKDARALMQESKKIMSEAQSKRSRVMFDLVGPAYTMVLESTHENLGEFENNMKDTFKKEEWGAWYQKFIPVVEKSYREIFTIEQ